MTRNRVRPQAARRTERSHNDHAIPGDEIGGSPGAGDRRAAELPGEHRGAPAHLTAGEAIAAFGLGLAVGVAVGLLLQVGPSSAEQALSTSGEAPGQYT